VDALTVMEGRVTLGDEDTEKLVDKAKTTRFLLFVLGTLVPLVTLLLGLLLIGAGLLIDRRRPGYTPEAGDDQPVRRRARARA
jgi:hypothetical protein